MTKKTWDEILRVAKLCQRTWGMGFPVISVTLLEGIVKHGAELDERHITRDPHEYLAHGPTPPTAPPEPSSAPPSSK